MNNKLLIVLAVVVIVGSISGAFYYNLTRTYDQKLQQGLLPIPGENQISVSFSTVTVTATTSETVLSSFGGVSTFHSSVISTFSSTQQPVEVFTTSSCNYDQNSSQCITMVSHEYSMALQNMNGADCTYGAGESYKLNGTVLAFWKTFSSSNDSVSQYVNIYLAHFSLFYQNGTNYGSGFQPGAPKEFTGNLPYNITKFSILSNNNMVLDTSPLNLNYDPCFPTSLVLTPVIA